VDLVYQRRKCSPVTLGSLHAIQEVQGQGPGPRGATGCLQKTPSQIKLLTSGGGWDESRYLNARRQGE
jgi:hypothetical protein